MRIALVIEHFAPHRGGAEGCTFQLARQLQRQGHEIHVVAQDFSPAGLELPIVAHPIGRGRSRIRRASAAEAKLRSLDLDVIHDMGMGWYCHVFESHDGCRLAQREQKLLALPPWIRAAKRGLFKALPRYREFVELESRQLADPDRIVLALSQMVSRHYQQYHGVRPDQIRVIYNGVDTGSFSPVRLAEHRDAVRRELGVGQEEMLCLFVGHDFDRKGLATAIRAVGRLAAAREPVRLLVVGGKRRPHYLRLAERCRAKQAIRFLGRVQDAIPYYAAGDVHVLPTFYDPCSLSVLEAAAGGLPSVTTRFNGASELLVDGTHGYVLADPRNDEEFAARLRELLDSSLRRRMGEAARELSLQHTLQHNCDQFIDLYHEIIERRSHRKSCPPVVPIPPPKSGAGRPQPSRERPEHGSDRVRRRSAG